LIPSRVQAALKQARDKGVRDKGVDDKGISLRSIHHYTRTIKGFSRWLWRDGRVREDKLAHLTSQNPEADRRHERRALTPEEQARLIEAADAGPIVLKMTGRDRAALYRLALGTGFRANELRSLTPEAFDLDADTPTVTVAAAYSKRRRDDVQPIRPDLAEIIHPWLGSKAPGQPIFGNLTKHTNLLIQADLKAAGIDYWDVSDRVADFHSLRHSFVTALAMSNAPVKVIQSLARHSTPTLTLGVYAHVGLYDQTSALDALPGQDRPSPDATEAPALAATGTIGRIGMRPPLPVPYGGDGLGRIVSVRGELEDVMAGKSDGISDATELVKSKGFSGSIRPLSAPVGSGGGGIRTPGTLAGTTVFKTVPIGHSGTPPGD
jgi:integrase